MHRRWHATSQQPRFWQGVSDMSTHSIPVTTCDRCGYVEEFRKAEKQYAWGGLNYSEYNGPRWAGSQRSAKPKWVDICPPCLTELHDWFLSGKERP